MSLWKQWMGQRMVLKCFRLWVWPMGKVACDSASPACSETTGFRQLEESSPGRSYQRKTGIGSKGNRQSLASTRAIANLQQGLQVRNRPTSYSAVCPGGCLQVNSTRSCTESSLERPWERICRPGGCGSRFAPTALKFLKSDTMRQMLVLCGHELHAWRPPAFTSRRLFHRHEIYLAEDRSSVRGFAHRGAIMRADTSLRLLLLLILCGCAGPKLLLGGIGSVAQGKRLFATRNRSTPMHSPQPY